MGFLRLRTAYRRTILALHRRSESEKSHYSDEERATSSDHERFNLLDRLIVHRPLLGDSIPGSASRGGCSPRGFARSGCSLNA